MIPLLQFAFPLQTLMIPPLIIYRQWHQTAETVMAGKNNRNHKVTFAEMLRDVLVSSMNKGQFPLAIVGLILIIALWRMPSEAVGVLVFSVAADLKSGYLVGYAIALMALFGWFLHAKAQRRWAADEMKRVTEERTKIQEEKTGTKLQSSEKR